MIPKGISIYVAQGWAVTWPKLPHYDQKAAAQFVADRLPDLLKERDEMIEALRFYGNQQNYAALPEDNWVSRIKIDDGEKARALLARIEGEE